MYQLKKGVESFEVVDGPMAGRKFFRGRTYAEIPSGDKNKFEKVQGSSVQGAAVEKAKSKSPEPKALNPEPEVKP